MKNILQFLENNINNKKIIKNIKIKVLNRLINSEILAINSYHIFCGIIKDNTLKKHLYEHIIDENEHLNLLINYFSDNDYTYNINIKDNNDYLNEIFLFFTDDYNCINEIQKMERNAISSYKTSIFIFKKLEDNNLVGILNYILKKEIEHFDDFQKFVEKIR